MHKQFNMDNHALELWRKYPEVLQMLLVDHTRSGVNDNVHDVKDLKDVHFIMWLTDDYVEQYGELFANNAEITPDLVNSTDTVIRRRSQKSLEEQTARSKGKAEVFTPAWVCNAQNNLVDNAWFGTSDNFNTELPDKINTDELPWKTREENVVFPSNPEKSWKRYVQAHRMEMTCGEAPYLTSRYDAVTNRFIPVKDRIGLLDRKLRVINENASDADWLKWSYNALKCIYGFEWQGDSLFIARKEILFTWMEHYMVRFKTPLNYQSLRYAAVIISWNLWQMDGIRLCIPESNPAIPCKIRDWRQYTTDRKQCKPNPYYCEYFYESIQQPIRHKVPAPKTKKKKAPITKAAGEQLLQYA